MSKIDNVLRNTFSIAAVMFAVSVIITSVAVVSFSNADANSVIELDTMVPAHPPSIPVEGVPALRELITTDGEILVQVIEFEDPLYINANSPLNN